MFDEVIKKTLVSNINDYLNIKLSKEDEDDVKRIRAEIFAKNSDDEEERDDEE